MVFVPGSPIFCLIFASSSPSFVSHIRRLQDLAVNVDIAMCSLLTNQENSQDLSLLEQCSEDDDDQFRRRGKINGKPSF